MALLQSGTRIYGNAIIDTSLSISGSDTSTSNTTGALKVSGGIGVVGNVFSSGNVTALNASLGNIVVANYYTGTLTTAAQPNITSVGTLTQLSVSGNATITGNLTVNGTAFYANVVTLNVKDPIIEQGGSTDGAPLVADDGVDRGQLLHYYDQAPIDAFMGWKNANSEFIFASNASLTDNTVTVNSLGNVRANAFIGTFIGTADTAKQVTESTQSNITSVGTLTSLTVSGDITGTLATAAQPNITSLGNLTGLRVTGVSNVGPIGNLKITGGTNGYVIQTDGTGNLSWANLSASLGNANVAGSNTQIQYNDGTNLAGSANLTFNAATSTLSVIGNITATNANLGNLATANFFSGDGSLLTNLNIAAASVANANYAAYAGTVTTNAQPNITSVGTLTSLTVSGSTNLGAVSNVNIAGGTAGYVLKTDGTGNLSWVAQPTASSITVDNFTGNGVQTQFTLSTTPANVNQTSVNYNGTTLLRSAYTLSGAVITFSGAPADGSLLEITSISAMIGTGGTSTYSNSNVASYLPTYSGNLTFANAAVTGDIIPTANVQYSLGNATNMWKDVFVGPGSLYVNGVKVLEQVSTTMIFSADPDQNLRITTSGTGDIELLPVGTGKIAVKGALQIQSNVNITSNDGNAIGFAVPVLVDSITSKTANSDLILTAAGTGSVKVADDFVVTGNLTVQGVASILSVASLSVEDNIIDISAETTGTPSNNAGIRVVRGDEAAVQIRWNETTDTWQFTNDGATYVNLSAGGTTYSDSNVASYLTTYTGNLQASNVTFSGANVTLGAASNLHITGGTTGQVLTTDGAGNLSFATPPVTTTIAGANVTGTVANATYSVTAGSATTASSATIAATANAVAGANVSGQVANALVSGTVYTNAQPNITSVGTLTSLAVTGNITAGNANLGNLVIANFFSGSGNLLSNIQGANVSGAVSSATTAGTVTTAAQANITSVGTLTGLTSGGVINYTSTSNVALGAVANVHITGGTSGQVLTTDGVGNLSWTTSAGGGGGVTSITGTANQITASVSTGAVTLSLPQSIATTSSVQFNSFGVGTAASGTTGEIRATNEITAYYSSDRNLKENIVPIDNALGKLRQISGVMFDWTDEEITRRGGEDGYFVRKQDTGIIAQDVEIVLPEVVATRPDGYKAVKYEKMAGLIIQAINELADQLDEIKKRLD